jgi:hypothetical protein
MKALPILMLSPLLLCANCFRREARQDYGNKSQTGVGTESAIRQIQINIYSLNEDIRARTKLLDGFKGDLSRFDAETRAQLERQLESATARIYPHHQYVDDLSFMRLSLERRLKALNAELEIYQIFIARQRDSSPKSDGTNY